MPQVPALLPGSEEHLRAGERVVKPAAPQERLPLTIFVRRPANSPSADALLSGEKLSRGEAEQALAANPADLQKVEGFVKSQGMSIVDVDAASRRLKVTATPSQIASAFDVQLQSVEDEQGHQFLTYQGSIAIPAELSGIVVSVLGLSQRAVAQHH